MESSSFQVSKSSFQVPYFTFNTYSFPILSKLLENLTFCKPNVTQMWGRVKIFTSFTYVLVD